MRSASKLSCFVGIFIYVFNGKSGFTVSSISMMIDFFYSANFYLPCKNVLDQCDKLQICKFL